MQTLSDRDDASARLESASVSIPPEQRAAFLRSHIRTIPDWPLPGVQFRDVTTLLAHRDAWKVTCDAFAERYRDQRIDYVAGLEARGFVIGAALAYLLGCGFIALRKPGKLPYQTFSESYALEYAQASLEVHVDAARPGDRVLLVDDLIATGGSLGAAKRLLERLGVEIVEAAVIIDLPELGGTQRLRDAGLPIFTLCEFAGH